MKKIITLLLAAGAFATASAQTTKEEARKVILGGDKKGDNKSTGSRDIILGDDNGKNTERYPGSTTRQAQIDQINREYDNKISSIRNNGTLSAAEKEKIIRDLERERARKIKQVDGDDKKKVKKDKKHKSNNGKHKGWTKGKGNKHKDRG